MSYTRADVRAALNRRIHGKIGILPDPDATINDAATELTARVDLRSMKRSATLTPDLEDEAYEYTWPTDAKGHKIIDLQPVDVDRYRGQDWRLLPIEEFDERKLGGYNLLSFKQVNAVTKLLVSADYNNDGSVDHTLLYYSKYPWKSSGGTWKARSTADSDILNLDEDEYSMFIEKLVEWGADEVREERDSVKAANKFKELVREYRKTYKSEAIPMISSYHDL